MRVIDLSNSNLKNVKINQLMKCDAYRNIKEIALVFCL